MEHKAVIESIKGVAKEILPKGSALWLYGSRARGDARDDSDWDLLLLLDKQVIGQEDYFNYAYPLLEKGWDLGQDFSVHTYTKSQWNNAPHAMFYYNVENDKIVLL